jgi:phosphate uptake regulator
MSELQKIELNGKPISARELTVREMDAVMENLKDNIMHPLEVIYPEALVPAVAVALSIGDRLADPSDVTELEQRLDELKDIVPSMVPDLFKMVAEKNNSLVQAVINLAEVAERLQATEAETPTQEEDSTTSGDQSVD